MDCRDDNGAIAKAKLIATQLNHRHVAVLNNAGTEIFQVPIQTADLLRAFLLQLF
jgi:hypothetical protein